MKDLRNNGVVVHLGPLGRGEHELRYTPEPEDLDLDDRFSDVLVDVRVIITGSQVIAIIDASATATLECDRTLEAFDMTVDGSSSVLGSMEDSKSTDAYDDVVEISAADQTLDLSAIVRDTLLLAVPSRVIAPGAEDEPIQTVFSDNNEDQIDPRWEGLKKIRNKG